MKTPVGLVTAALAVAILLAVSFLIATGTRGEDAGVRLVGGRTRGSHRRQRPRQSVGAGVPARRHDAGDRASGPHAHRHERRTGLAAAQGRARGVGVGPGRPARRRHRQILCAEQDHLFLLCRAGRRRRTHRGRARQTRTTARAGSTTSRSSSASRGRCHRAIIMAAASRRPTTAICSSRWASISPTATRRKVSAIISAR